MGGHLLQQERIGSEKSWVFVSLEDALDALENLGWERAWGRDKGIDVFLELVKRGGADDGAGHVRPVSGEPEGELDEGQPVLLGQLKVQASRFLK